jgi:hypothetical protein
LTDRQTDRQKDTEKTDKQKDRQTKRQKEIKEWPLALLVRICRGESHFSQKWPLANVGESGEYSVNGLEKVGKSGESCIFPKMAILASTRTPQKQRIFGEYSNLLNSLASGHSLKEMQTKPTFSITRTCLGLPSSKALVMPPGPGPTSMTYLSTMLPVKYKKCYSQFPRL